MFRSDGRTAIGQKVTKEGTADETVDRACTECTARRFGAWCPSVLLPVPRHLQLQNRRCGGGCAIPLPFPGKAVGLRPNFECGAGRGGHSGIRAYCAAGSSPRSARRQHGIFLHHLCGVLGASPLLLPPDLGFSCLLRLGQDFRCTRGYADLDPSQLRSDNARGQARFWDGGRGRHCGSDFCWFPLQNHGQEVRNRKSAAGHDAVRFNLRRSGDLGLAQRASAGR